MCQNLSVALLWKVFTQTHRSMFAKFGWYGPYGREFIQFGF